MLEQKGGTAQRSDRAGPLGSSGRRTIFDVTRLPAVVKAMGTQLKGGVGQVVGVSAIVAIPTDDAASRLNQHAAIASMSASTFGPTLQAFRA